jgi:hypothetical protein
LIRTVPPWRRVTREPEWLLLVLCCWVIDAPMAHGADAGVGISAGPLVGEPILRTTDPWVRFLTLNGDTLAFIQTETIRHGDDVFKGDGIFAVPLSGAGARSARRLVAADLPDAAAYAAMERREERDEKAGAVPFESPLGFSTDNASWLSAADGRLFWKDERADLKAMTPPQGAVETFAPPIFNFDVLADDVLWMNRDTLMHRPTRGGVARVLLPRVRGTATRLDEDAMVVAQKDGKRTRLIVYRARDRVARVVGSVPFTARPLAGDVDHIYLDAGRRLVAYSTASATVVEIARVPSKLDKAVVVGPFIIWQLQDSWKLWRRRIDGSDPPTVIANAFRVEAVCGRRVMQGESSGRIRALSVADGVESTVATSREPGSVRYLFRGPHHLYWQTKGTIYRVPLECEGRSPFPLHGMPPEVNRNGEPNTIDGSAFD